MKDDVSGIIFSNQQERKNTRTTKVCSKKIKIGNNSFAFVKMCLSKLSYFFCITMADIVHFSTAYLFEIFYRFHKLTFILLYLVCALNYFHLHGFFVTKDNLLVPSF